MAVTASGARTFSASVPERGRTWPRPSPSMPRFTSPSSPRPAAGRFGSGTSTDSSQLPSTVSTATSQPLSALSFVISRGASANCCPASQSSATSGPEFASCSARRASSRPSCACSLRCAEFSSSAATASASLSSAPSSRASSSSCCLAASSAATAACLRTSSSNALLSGSVSTLAVWFCSSSTRAASDVMRWSSTSTRARRPSALRFSSLLTRWCSSSCSCQAWASASASRSSRSASDSADSALRNSGSDSASFVVSSSTWARSSTMCCSRSFSEAVISSYSCCWRACSSRVCCMVCSSRAMSLATA